MSWDEREGILEHKPNGFVAVGYHCHRCQNYWTMEMVQDDYEEARLKTELCYACDLRRQLAIAKWGKRVVLRTAKQIVATMEEELDILLTERKNHEHLLQSGSNIISQQDNIIRDLKKRLDKKPKKR